MSVLNEIEASQRSSFEGLDVPWMLETWAERTPEKTCLVWRPFEGEQRSWSYAKLLEDASRLGAGLKNQGVGEGDFVILHMDNSPEFILSWYARAIIGAVAVSTNTRSVARDMSYFSEVMEAICALTQPKYADLLADSCRDIEFLAVTNTDAGAVNADQAAIMQRSGAIPFESLFSDAPSPDSAGKLSWTRRCRNTTCASGASPQPYRSWVRTLASIPSPGGE